jgi:alginate O-acetyltransferase complex protein AlgI
MTVQNLYYFGFVALVLMLAQPLRSLKTRQTLLLAASYTFYATWGWGFLAILIASSLVNFACGIWLHKKPTAARLWAGLIFNLLLLSFFKYLPSLAGNGPHVSASGSFLYRIATPVGISFWTFQAMSYLFDLYREKDLNPSLPEFCLYMAFWPTVLSGPVCRLGEMLPQFRRASATCWNDLTAGTRRIAIGLFFKLALAQLLAVAINSMDGGNTGSSQVRGVWSGLDVWVLAIGFGFQLYFDFAGYSHIVIGTARLFGFTLRENFDDPYISPTPSAFWNRWHMSLSFWIRDYVFLPLATVRHESWWRHFALMASMTLFGLWHGGSLPFILWGTYQGVLLVIHRQGQRLWGRIVWPLGLGELLSWALTFASISLGWVFFRAQNLSQAVAMLASALRLAGFVRLNLSRNSYLIVAGVAAGYFAFAAMRSWTLRTAGLRDGLAVGLLEGRMGFGSGVVVFSWQNKWWFLAPGIITMAALLFLLVSGGHYASVPFIYTRF